MSRVRFPRGAAGELPVRAQAPAALVLTGPPGAGKTTLLVETAAALRAEGWEPIYLDLLGAASSPERFVRAALEALPAEARAERAADVERALALTAGGKLKGADVVRALFDLWASLDTVGGRPAALLLDEATEIRSLAYFDGLREVEGLFGVAMAGRARGTVLATSRPTAARERWPDLTQVPLEPVTMDALGDALEQARVVADAEALALASFGLPSYLDVLLDSGGDVARAWTAVMTRGGRLERLCRHTYESLLLRSRGYGMSKAVLAAVAEEEGLNLTALVGRLQRSPGAIRDYLGWLLDVDALRVDRKRYFYVDGLVRVWVRLHGLGVIPAEGQVATAARELITATGATAVRMARNERLMEID
jgi:AAA domain-containing protein